jgi:putative transposase
MAPAKIAAQLQGYTSRILRQAFRFLRSQLPSLWSRSYSIGSVGHVSEATVRREREHQKSRHSMSVITYKYRIKESTSGTHLRKMAGAIHYVWNYCNEVSLLAFRRDKTFLSAYDLHTLTAGTSKDLRLSADTIQQVGTEYVTRRKQWKQIKLKWRSHKRSLGWIPFKAAYIILQGDTVTYCGHRFHLWLSRPLDGVIKTGSFVQDARGRWYVTLQCEVPDAIEPVGQLDLGVDLGLKHQMTCSDGVQYTRENLTKKYEDALAMAQRAHKKKHVKAIQARIANVRTDWTHKATTDITRRAKYIVIGDVSSAKLVKTMFATSTLDATWYSVRHQLNYKAKRLAGVCVSGRENWSSVTCSDCGARSGPSGLRALGVREWLCTRCGCTHARDVNAAKNILAFSPCGTSQANKGIRLLELAEDVKGSTGTRSR